MTQIEGELEINELGQFLIDNNFISAGTIIELEVESEWIEVCIESALGNYYSVPHLEFPLGLKARMAK